MFKFPFSNLHELNLDWILNVVIRFSELIPPMETAVEDVQALQDDVAQAVTDANTAVTAANQAAETAAEALEVAEQAASGTIADGAVTTPKLANRAVTGDKIADGTITGAKLADSTIYGAKIAQQTILSGNLAEGCVTSEKILDETIQTVDIADEAITTAKLADTAVTNDKLSNGAVTNNKIADGAVTNIKLSSDTLKWKLVGTATGTSPVSINDLISTAREFLVIVNITGNNKESIIIPANEISGTSWFRAGGYTTLTTPAQVTISVNVNIAIVHASMAASDYTNSASLTVYYR